MITILGVPGVMNNKIIICRNSIKSWGNIFTDSPNEPGAKNGLIGLSSIFISQLKKFALSIFLSFIEFYEKIQYS